MVFKAFFVCEPIATGYRIRHNYNGDLNFTAEEEISIDLAKLIEFAIEEGKRQRSREILALLDGE